MKDSLRDLDYAVLQQCMHCGMCLPSCPTYVSTGRERHSPRGRIALMRAVADGHLEVGDELASEMDYCLGCLACTSACPAGVDYGTMFETARAEVEREVSSRRKKRRFLRRMFLDRIFLHPGRLRRIGALLRWYQASGLDRVVRFLRLPYVLGRSLGNLERQTPRLSTQPTDRVVAEWEEPPAGIPIRGAIGLLSGCIQSIAFAEVNRDTADVLLANGWRVHTPRAQSCCGSLHAHNGAPDLAKRAATALMDAFSPEWDRLDAIITNAGGCGSHLKQYRSLFPPDSPESARAALWDARVKDIHEFLADTGFRRPDTAPSPGGVLTYHESCHLCHGQGIRAAPREILRSLPGWELRELPGADVCCGSAGIYNILQPEESDRILERKIEAIRRLGPACVATSNPGCHLQIQRGLDSAGLDVTVTQPVTLLARAYRQR